MCSLFSTLRELAVNRKDLRALTLMGPPRDNPEINPLPVLPLDSQLYMCNDGLNIDHRWLSKTCPP